MYRDLTCIKLKEINPVFVGKEKEFFYLHLLLILFNNLFYQVVLLQV